MYTPLTIAIDLITDGPLRRAMRAAGNFTYDRATGTERPDWNSLAGVQAAGQERRMVNAEHVQKYDGEFDWPYVTSMEQFALMAHETIYSEVKVMSAQNVDASVALWRSAAETVRREGEAFIDGLRNIIGTDWDGPAARAAEEGAQRFIDSVHSLSRTAEFVARSADTGSEGIHETTARIPEPQTPSFTERALSMTPYPGLFKAAQQRADEAEDYARDVMSTIYAPAVTDSDAIVPVLARPHDPTAGSDGNGPGQTVLRSEPGRPHAGSGSTGSTGSTAVPIGIPGASESVTPAMVQPGQLPNAHELSPAARVDPAAAPSGSTGVSGSGAGQPGSLRASEPGVQGGVAVSPGGRSAARGGPSGGITSPLAGRGSLGAARPAPEGVSQRGISAGTSASTPNAGARSGMGAFAPMAGAAGQTGEKDHQTPKYLYSRRNGEDIIGPLRKVTPPVIGGD
ncbi:hypothetical protein [Hoyosella subflava]|uniref:Pe-pgrs family protein n=1 Tax=Hoyosella subflava (strain DSM 45089 / JCM 17490 / NBRC 109087 / DQS3-9A1) TaxID=443218 RepID=F6EHG7_HOYSD|nr:hypothetical protein [Hoyosella subflava]AEF41146.1 Pe-pgrs family protein [Hoyosella subflava DQS3-9A1]